MCAVIDPPIFIAIIKPDDARHGEFGQLKHWLTNGLGKAVIGGAKYRKELENVRSVLGFIGELEKRGKIVKVDGASVDAHAQVAVQAAASTDFDDEHLVALVACSGCRVVCLDDPRAHRFLKRSDLYAGKAKAPKLYTSSRNRGLLSEQYKASCCK